MRVAVLALRTGAVLLLLLHGCAAARLSEEDLLLDDEDRFDELRDFVFDEEQQLRGVDEDLEWTEEFFPGAADGSSIFRDLRNRRRKNGRGRKRKGGRMRKDMGECKLRPQVEPSFSSGDCKHLPGYVIVNRCGGCCSNGKCKAVKTEPVVKQIMQVDENGKLRARRNAKTRTVEEDVACQCQCADDGSKCPRTQTWDAATCQCKCNESEKKRCQSKRTHQWDGVNCSCQCMETNRKCSTGENFSHNHCRCVEVRKWKK